jgi:hypothetical protein
MMQGAVLAVLGGPTLPAWADGSGNVVVLSTSQWGPDGSGQEHFVGEVQNDGTQSTFVVEVDLGFYDVNDNLVGTDSVFTTLDSLAPGEKSPFEDIFPPPAGYDHAAVTSIETSWTSQPPNHDFDVVLNQSQDAAGRTNDGTVTNLNTTSADDVNVVFTFYNSAGTVVGQDQSFVIGSNGLSNLAPGQSAPFLETVEAGLPGYSTVAVTAQSDTAVSPASSMHRTGPYVAIAPALGGTGYLLGESNGAVVSEGSAATYGSMAGKPLAAPVVGLTRTPDGRGYWLVAADGGVFAFGDAGYYGSMGGRPLDAPVVGIAADPAGTGYWLVAADGGIFAFGSASFMGSMGGRALNAPMVGMAADPATKGYWLVAADGGVFAFGNAPFNGSAGGLSLNQPVVAMAADTTTSGYWLLAADGGVFAYGAPFAGAG